MVGIAWGVRGGEPRWWMLLRAVLLSECTALGVIVLRWQELKDVKKAPVEGGEGAEGCGCRSFGGDGRSVSVAASLYVCVCDWGCAVALVLWDVWWGAGHYCGSLGACC